MARRLFTSTNDLDILLMVRDARLDRLHKYADGVSGRAARARRCARCSAGPRIAGRRAAQFRDALDEWIRRTTRVTSRDLAALDRPGDQRADRRSRRRARRRGAGEDDLGPVGPDDAHEHRARRGRGRSVRAPSSSRRGAIPEGVGGVEGSSGTHHGHRGRRRCPRPRAGVGSARGRRAQGARRSCAWSIGSRGRRAPACSTLEGRAGVLKEAYFLDGQPQFVELERRERAARQLPARAGRADAGGAAARALGDAPLRRPARRHARRPRSPRSARGVPPAREAGRREADGGVLVAEGPLHVDAARSRTRARRARCTSTRSA